MNHCEGSCVSQFPSRKSMWLYVMSRKDRYELVIWYSNWRAWCKLQAKDVKFSRSERGMKVAPIPSSTKRLKSSGIWP